MNRYLQCLPCLMLALLSLSGCTSEAVWYHFTPMVIEETSTADVKFEVKVDNSPDSVEFALSIGVILPVVDDGTSGDLVAGDKIYTATLSSAQILHNFTPDDVNRNFVGYLRLYKSGEDTKQYNIFADILTSGIPPVVITPLTANIQYTENLVNIVDPAFYNTFSIPDVATTFYSQFGDLYDFIDVIYEYSYFRNRNHGGVQNSVTGIGISVFDNTASYGSSGRLLGRSEFPIATYYDGASPGYSHELGHQWINFVSVPPLDFAIPHWPLSDLASGSMGWAHEPGGQGLQFNFDLVPSGADYELVANDNPKEFSDLSLYLMGLVPASEVESHFVFNNQSQTPSAGGILLGPVTTVNVSDVITHLGARVPAYPKAQKKFCVAAIIVSKNGLLSENTMRLYDWFARRAGGTTVVPYSGGLVKGQTKPFYLATKTKGQLKTRIERRILVDASRDGGVWWYPQAGSFDQAAPHQGKALADHLRSSGYKVTELPRPYSISGDLLGQYDMVIRAGVFGNYTAAEISAYSNYINNGGNLLLLADHSGNDGLAASMDLTFVGKTRGENLLTDYTTHPVTQGLGPLFYNVGSSLSAYPASAQILGRMSPGTYTDLNNNGVQDEGEPVGAPVLGVMEIGEGRVVFAGDTNMWETVPQPLVDNVMNWFEFCN